MKIDAKFEGKLTCTVKNDMRNLTNFILESKMAELNQSKNSKQPDWPDALLKLYSIAI